MLNAEEKAYRSIFKDIIEGKYSPGDFLLEIEIAPKLKMSRTPVRSALSRLVSDGYISKMPKKGCYIPTPTPQEVRNTFFARQLIEGESAALAALNAEEKEIAMLDEIIIKDSSTFSRKETDLWANVNKELHFSIARFTHNPHIEKWVQQIYWHSYVYLSYLNGFYLSEEASMSNYKTPEFHQEIVNAIKKRDTICARKLMSEHISYALSFHFNL